MQRVPAQVAFAPANNYATRTLAASVTAADVNADGRTDLIILNAAPFLTVLTNNGAGGFGSNGTYTVSNIFAVTSADVNGDGYVDLIAATASSVDPGRLLTLTNNGFGRFQLSSSNLIGRSSSSRSVTASDIMKHGWMDLIAANSLDGTLSVLTNNGNGNFSLSGTYAVGLSSSPSCVIAADVSGDSWPDLICANPLTDSLSVFTNDHTGHFKLSSSPSVGPQPNSVAAADVNGDGRMDLITANNGVGTGGFSLSVLTNNSMGAFALSATYRVGNNPNSVVATDVNADGTVDLICANIEDNTLSVLTNDSSGGFMLAMTCDVGKYPHGLTAADVNGDGHMDLISANLGDGTVSVLVNVPKLSISCSGNTMIVSYPSFWTNWTLFQNSSLVPALWSAAAGVVNDGTNQSLTVTSATNNQFFRLSYP